jgi:hypothetical protein
VAGYNLQPSESFVHKRECAIHDGAYLDELILTSKNLVLIKTARKGLLGKEQVIQVLPLSQIKIFQGHAQALVGKQQYGSPTLDVYFENGTEQFGFGSKHKKEAAFWSQKINEVITGTPATMISPDSSAAEQVAGALKDTVGVFKDALGLKPKSEVAAAAAAVPVARGCVSCGAPISGIRGQAIICGYCDTANQL